LGDREFEPAFITEGSFMVTLPAASKSVGRERIASILILAFAGSAVFAQAPQDPPSDVVCEKLLDEYILKRGKIESANIDAAIQLIASRGRENGFWREVVAHFEQSPVNDSRGSQSALLLQILTKMLRRDGHARWLHSHPEEMKRSAWVANVALPGRVVDVIMARAKQAGRLTLDDYVVALVAAHDPRTRDFLRAILERGVGAERGDDLFDAPGTKAVSVPKTEPVLIESRFHAAVGLAELGDISGIQWLVETDASVGSFYENAGHIDARGNYLQSRVLALADLTGESFKTIEEAQSWWAAKKSTAKAFEPKKRVLLRYP
jgi:hypothetical protein